jgi:hypothetical protein
MSAKDISFLPDGYLERKARHRSNMICGSLMLVVLGVVGFTWWRNDASLHQLEQEHSAKQQQHQESAKKIELARSTAAKSQVVDRQAELTASLLEKVPRSNVLAEITGALPESVSLLDFGLESKLHPTATPTAGAAAAAAAASSAKEPATADPLNPKVYDVTVKMTGIAYNDTQVAQLIARLGRSKLFVDVNLVVSDEYGTSEPKMRKFQIEMTINPAANLTRDENKVRSETVSLPRN